MYPWIAPAPWSKASRKRRRDDGLAIEKRERRDGGFGMEMMERRGGGFAMEKRERSVWQQFRIGREGRRALTGSKSNQFTLQLRKRPRIN